MAPKPLLLPILSLLLLLLLLLIVSAAKSHAASDDGGFLLPANETLEWALELEEDGGRRSLYWQSPKRYYISYGALSANRVPCPPRSGRSYYTHNCFKARGAVHPYTRGCSAITRCRR